MIVLLDANVLYPAPVRDLLLSLASRKLFQPKWTLDIQDEWIRNLLKNRPDLTKETLGKTVSAMNAAFPDADIRRYHSAIEHLSLPDQDDRHVLAAAMKAMATILLTFNLKDFPAEILAEHGVRAMHPDEFIAGLFQENPEQVLLATDDMLARLRNPRFTRREMLDSLIKSDLPKTATILDI